jgi:Family of unknown function (DUF6503)
MLYSKLMVSSTLKIILASLLLFSCSAEKEKILDGQEIMESSIQAHGGSIFDHSSIEFDFRKKHYKRMRDGGNYTFSREFEDSGRTILDVLDNNGLKRFIDGEEIDLEEKWRAKYSRSVNSVIYFALLPYRLNDHSVYKKLLGMETIKNKEYHKVRISFGEEGGGEDFQDIFIYWVNKESFKVDYLAYSYETDGGGMRFREAKNKRRIGGILFQDYNNFKEPKDSTIIGLEMLASEFEKGNLKLLSKIILEGVRVGLE